MDAISFVLGVRAAHLRGSQLKDLIYNPEGKAEADADKASVKLVLRSVASDDELVFQRSVTRGGSTEYRIDGTSVTKQRYDARLQQLNILVKARNFLVFQVVIILSLLATARSRRLSLALAHNASKFFRL
jgi:structural maintenance of chromosome 1